MKKALLLLLVCLSAAGMVFAGRPPAANVNFTSERGVPFAVLLDGRPLTRGLARQVHVGRLVPGFHYADFSVPTRYGGAVRLRSRVWLEPGLETTFVLLTRPGRPLGLRQVGAVVLYNPYGPGYEGGCQDDHPSPGYGADDDYDDDDDYNGSGHYQNRDGYSNGAYGQQAPGAGRNQPGRYENDRRPAEAGGASGQPGSYGPNGEYTAPPTGGGSNYPNSSGAYRLMASPDVDGLTQALSQTSSEEERLQLGRQALNQSSIRAEDLQLLLQGFQFDASRGEFAKFAYPHVADRQNFYKVYSSFDFSTNAREVQDAVARM